MYCHIYQYTNSREPGWAIEFARLQLLDTKLLATLTTPSLLEKAVSHCIDQGQLRRHAERIRSQLDAARGRSVKLALTHGYLLAPGALFLADRRPSTLMRINFATTQNAEFWQVFAKVVRRQPV